MSPTRTSRPRWSVSGRGARAFLGSFVAGAVVGLLLVAVDVTSPDEAGLAAFFGLLGLLALAAFVIGVIAARGRALEPWLAAYGGIVLAAWLGLVASVCLEAIRCQPGVACPGFLEIVTAAGQSAGIVLIFTGPSFRAGTGLSLLVKALRSPRTAKGAEVVPGETGSGE